MAFKKSADGKVADLVSLEAWNQLHGRRAFGKKTAAAKKVSADQSKYLLSHVSIMASVHCEDDPFEFRIRPEASAFVNSNDDAWENTVLRMSYRTFVGGFNFVEHFQNTKASKGHLLDAVLRKINLTEACWIYYVDLLVATDLRHEQLVSDIRSEKTKYLSMGCTTDLVVCSYCGAHATDPASFCSHLRFNKGEFLLDEEGTARRVAELCGHKSLPGGGVKFVEASWVATPAFPGAAKRTIVLDEWSGPRTPYTHAASAQGMQKAAHFKRTEDSQADAALRRLLLD